ncbi:MAG: sterol desaturase family protein, partial [Verrucomicrobiota bacterium]
MSATLILTTPTLRTHFLEFPIQAAIISSPLIFLLNYPTREIIFILTPLLTFWLFFVHTNIRLHLGWFSRIFTGPQTHRIHHSIEENHRNKNFAQFFPVIDIIFGTYHHPKQNEFPKTGIDDTSYKRTLSSSLLKPFKSWLGIK